MTRILQRLVFFVSFVCFVVPPVFGAEGWATYRGNPERSGSDGQPGPASGKVLWVYNAKDHFIAAPLPVGDRLFVSGLGTFNVSTFLSLNIHPKAKERVAW